MIFEEDIGELESSGVHCKGVFRRLLHHAGPVCVKTQ